MTYDKQILSLISILSLNNLTSSKEPGVTRSHTTNGVRKQDDINIKAMNKTTTKLTEIFISTCQRSLPSMTLGTKEKLENITGRIEFFSQMAC